MRSINEKMEAGLEARAEWSRFAEAIQISQPATATFTNEALMMIHLMLGDTALRLSPDPVAPSLSREKEKSVSALPAKEEE